MACNSCPSNKRPAQDSAGWRRVLWVALAINAGMFTVELAAGVAVGSKALQADALDFFGDAANYAISLGVAGMVLACRARAALVKGVTIIALASTSSPRWPGRRWTAACRAPR